MSKHTSGPWTMRANIDRSKKALFPFEIHAKNGRRVAVTTREPKGADIEAANARLIAAGPDLELAAGDTVKRLERLTEMLRPEQYAAVRVLVEMALRDTRHALAKARGE